MGEIYREKDLLLKLAILGVVCLFLKVIMFPFVKNKIGNKIMEFLEKEIELDYNASSRYLGVDLSPKC